MKIKSLYLIVFSFIVSCASVDYGMLDGSIDAETFSVELFEEQAANAPAGYGATFTDFLKDYMISRTKLNLLNKGADIEIYGKISYYNTSPVSVQSDNVAAVNRLTVKIDVTVINNVNENQSFESVFSQISDFDSNQDLASVQDELLEDINGKLSQDIINKLTSNW
ncbi:LPS assembly lipoprotein LptE [Crocinitomix algicola]|uniref:LPS assembly lipoprotein LptE n=1 Tax=Crocinitomix algicola TaxID=1740263 RepID=UPI001112F67F|nr:LPS assembly lipoprotein LptE [Crocinitomix algicola]